MSSVLSRSFAAVETSFFSTGFVVSLEGSSGFARYRGGSSASRVKYLSIVASPGTASEEQEEGSRAMRTIPMTPFAILTLTPVERPDCAGAGPVVSGDEVGNVVEIEPGEFFRVVDLVEGDPKEEVLEVKRH